MFSRRQIALLWQQEKKIKNPALLTTAPRMQILCAIHPFIHMSCSFVVVYLLLENCMGHRQMWLPIIILKYFIVVWDNNVAKFLGSFKIMLMT